MGRYLTPDDTGGTILCRQLRFRAEMASIISGALEQLTNAWEYEAFGNMTPDQCAAAALEMLNEYADRGDACMIGTLTHWITANPPVGALELDGSTYNDADYPSLAAIIDAVFNNGDGTFTLPDLRGRVLVGAGAGAGLTARAVGDSWGLELVTLVAGEMPAHTHTDTTTGLTVADPLLGVPTPVASPAAPSITGSAGGGAAHENSQPSGVSHVGVWYR